MVDLIHMKARNRHQNTLSDNDPQSMWFIHTALFLTWSCTIANIFINIFFATVLVLKQTYEQETNHPNIPKSTSAVCVTDQRIVKTLQYRLKHYTDIKLQKKKKKDSPWDTTRNCQIICCIQRQTHFRQNKSIKKNTNTMAIPRF